MKEIYIKNMVCQRCMDVVCKIFSQQGLPPGHIELGMVQIDAIPSEAQLAALNKELEAQGFALLDSAKQKSITKIKSLVINTIHNNKVMDLKVNWSDLIAGALNQDYSTLSALFSSVEGITLEQYIIRQKIERVKELLIYDELNLNEIAYQLGYSSVQHLSIQFKKVIGLTPWAFKQERASNNRKALDKI